MGMTSLLLAVVDRWRCLPSGKWDVREAWRRFMYDGQSRGLERGAHGRVCSSIKGYLPQLMVLRPIFLYWVFQRNLTVQTDIRFHPR